MGNFTDLIDRFHRNESLHDAPWGWMCSRTYQLLQNYSAGSTEVLLLMDLQKQWLKDQPVLLNRSMTDKVLSPSDVSQMLNLPESSVVEATVEEINLLEETSTKILLLCDSNVWVGGRGESVASKENSGRVEAYIHQKLDTSQLLTKGRVLRMCQCRLASGGNPLDPFQQRSHGSFRCAKRLRRLLPSEFTVLKLRPEELEPIRLKCVTNFSDLRNCEDGETVMSVCAKVAHVGPVVDSDDGTHRQQQSVTLEGTCTGILPLCLFDHQLALISAIKRGDWLVIYYPLFCRRVVSNKAVLSQHTQSFNKPSLSSDPDAVADVMQMWLEYATLTYLAILPEEDADTADCDVGSFAQLTPSQPVHSNGQAIGHVLSQIRGPKMTCDVRHLRRRLRIVDILPTNIASLAMHNGKAHVSGRKLPHEAFHICTDRVNGVTLLAVVMSVKRMMNEVVVVLYDGTALLSLRTCVPPGLAPFVLVSAPDPPQPCFSKDAKSYSPQKTSPGARSIPPDTSHSAGCLDSVKSPQNFDCLQCFPEDGAGCGDYDTSLLENGPVVGLLQSLCGLFVGETVLIDNADLVEIKCVDSAMENDYVDFLRQCFPEGTRFSDLSHISAFMRVDGAVPGATVVSSLRGNLLCQELYHPVPVPMVGSLDWETVFPTIPRDQCPPRTKHPKPPLGNLPELNDDDFLDLVDGSKIGRSGGTDCRETTKCAGTGYAEENGNSPVHGAAVGNCSPSEETIGRTFQKRLKGYEGIDGHVYHVRAAVVAVRAFGENMERSTVVAWKHDFCGHVLRRCACDYNSTINSTNAWGRKDPAGISDLNFRKDNSAHIATEDTCAPPGCKRRRINCASCVYSTCPKCGLMWMRRGCGKKHDGGVKNSTLRRLWCAVCGVWCPNRDGNVLENYTGIEKGYHYARAGYTLLVDIDDGLGRLTIQLSEDAATSMLGYTPRVYCRLSDSDKYSCVARVVGKEFRFAVHKAEPLVYHHQRPSPFPSISSLSTEARGLSPPNPTLISHTPSAIKSHSHMPPASLHPDATVCCDVEASAVPETLVGGPLGCGDARVGMRTDTVGEVQQNGEKLANSGVDLSKNKVDDVVEGQLSQNGIEKMTKNGDVLNKTYDADQQHSSVSVCCYLCSACHAISPIAETRVALRLRS
eukprot:Rmarinus@m.2237